MLAVALPAAPSADAADSRGGVQPQSRAGSVAVPRKKIVFLQGACTTLTSGTFDNLKSALKSSFGYTDADFLTYSYAGGRVDLTTGAWVPNAYSANMPISQPLLTSYGALRDQLLI